MAQEKAFDWMDRNVKILESIYEGMCSAGADKMIVRSFYVNKKI